MTECQQLTDEMKIFSLTLNSATFLLLFINKKNMKPLYTQQEYNESKSKGKLPCQCYNCSNTFLVYKSNIKHELEHNRGRVKFCSKQCNDTYVSNLQNVTCANCGIIVTKKQSELKNVKNSFCSMSCAGTFNGKLKKSSDESNIKRSKSLKLFHNGKREIDKIKTCKECKKNYNSRIKKAQFCSKNCASKFNVKNNPFFNDKDLQRLIGLKSVSAQSKNRRSKNEIYFGELCKQKFEDVVFNDPMFNGWDADVIIKELKLAILWNGKWHYEKITKKHSVEQVQNRDRIKQEEIIKAGYRFYVIKDMGKADNQFVKKKFEEMLAFLKL